MILEWKDKDKLLTLITVDFINSKVSIINYTDNIIERAFGVNENPSLEDFNYLVKSRCFSENAQELHERLRQIGLDHYNPLDIISRTNGVLAGDTYTLSIKEE